jgi:hypothetical protein
LLLSGTAGAITIIDDGFDGPPSSGSEPPGWTQTLGNTPGVSQLDSKNTAVARKMRYILARKYNNLSCMSYSDAALLRSR